MYNKPLITVAIATCNRADTLKRALSCIVNQELSANHTYEVVVIDNGSTDRTEEVVRTCDSENAGKVRYVQELRKGLPFVRNMAVRECRGEWLAFFDDDQLTDRRWLQTLYETATSSDAQFAGGSRDLVIEANEIPALSEESRFLLGEVLEPVAQLYHNKFLPSTGNVLIRRSLFDEVGTFDQEVLDGGEDSDFFNRVVRRGIKGAYNPEALVHHLISPNRLESDYLRWIAFRYGIHLGRRDVQGRGKWTSLILTTARWVRALLGYWPKMVYFWVQANQAEVVGMRCKIEKVEGYASYVWTRLFPSDENVKKLAERSTHRGSR